MGIIVPSPAAFLRTFPKSWVVETIALMFPSTSRKRTKAKQESNWGYVKYALNAHESFMFNGKHLWNHQPSQRTLWRCPAYWSLLCIIFRSLLLWALQDISLWVTLISDRLCSWEPTSLCLTFSFNGIACNGRRGSHPFNMPLESLSMSSPFLFQISSKHLSVATNVIPFPKGLIHMSDGLLVRRIHHYRS